MYVPAVPAHATMLSVLSCIVYALKFSEMWTVNLMKVCNLIILFELKWI